MALCRRCGLTPPRENGRRATTVQLCASELLHSKTVWPEYLALADKIDAHLDELTTDSLGEYPPVGIGARPPSLRA